MEKHRAVIIGAGRIGAGYEWPEHPFVYTHADAYLKLKDRVTLESFVEPDAERAAAAEKKYGIPAYRTFEDIPKPPNIVSICVKPEDRWKVFEGLTPRREYVNGLWIEKPFEAPARALDPTVKVQVNYIRRFDTLHRVTKQMIDQGALGKLLQLVVMAKHDIHTVCHFGDLSRWWGVDYTYVSTSECEYVNTEYELIGTKGKIRFYQGGMSATKFTYQESKWFPGAMVPHADGQLCPGEPKLFMERALGNLLDAVEGKAELLSPPY